MTSSSTTETTNQISSGKEGLSESVADAPPACNHPKDDDQSSRTAVIKDDSGDVLVADPEIEIDLEHGDGTGLKRETSNVILPRKKRRGLFASLVIGIPEIEDPKQYSKKIKAFIVFIIAMAAIAAPMGSLPQFIPLLMVGARYIYPLYRMSRVALTQMKISST
jgi:hypothetical protein